MADKKVFNIKFVTIEIASKSLVDPTAIKIKDDKNIDCRFDFLVDVKIGPSEKVALAVTDVTVIEAVTNIQLAKFKTICVFEFPENFDVYFTKNEENKYDMPVELEIILKSAGLSTTRGIIFSELRGTYLHGAILPLIDIASLIMESRKKKEIKDEQENNQS